MSPTPGPGPRLPECQYNLVDWRVALAAVCGIVAVTVVALLMGIDGLITKMALVALAGVGGFAWGKWLSRPKVK